MKLTNMTLTWMVAGMVSIALVVGANAQTTKERTGKVVRIKGAARYSMGNKIWQPLKVGTILKAGSVVQTAADSYADIVLSEDATADGVSMPPPHPASSPTALIPSPSSGGSGGNKAAEHDVVRVQSDSILAIDKVSATDTGADRVTDTELDLRSGSIFFSVKKQAAASRFEVKLPNGVAGIRGTMGLIFADGRIVCGAGSVVSAFTDSTGKVTTKVVPGGSQFNSGNGQTSAIGGALLGTIQSLAQDTSYGVSRSAGAQFVNVQNLGREQVSVVQP